MQLAAITINNEHRFVFCNDYFLQLTDGSREEVLRDNWIERFVRSEHKKLYRAGLKGLLREVIGSRDVEVDVVMKYGGYRRMAWHHTPSPSPSADTEGNIISVTAIEWVVSSSRIADRQTE
jgi:PAS domain-containing protein